MKFVVDPICATIQSLNPKPLTVLMRLLSRIRIAACIGALCHVNICMFAVNSERIDSLLAIIEQADPDTARVNTLNELAWEYRQQQPQLAVEYVDQALGLSRELSYAKGMAFSYNVLGIVHKNLTEYSEAVKFHKKSLALKKELKDSSGIAASYGNIGAIYFYKGDLATAYEFMLNAVKVLEQGGKEREISAAYNNLVIVAGSRGDHEKALELYNKALEIAIRGGDRFVIAARYHNIAGIYNGTGDTAKAISSTRH